ncbi:MAG: hypothetical protein AAFQ14_02435 [Cyanobacteria bacterium J06621_12]
MVEKIAFQCIGGIEGIYLPSQENPKYGTILSDHGIFPAETSKRVRKTFPRFIDSEIPEAESQTRLKFLTWIKGIEESPFYSVDLRFIREEFPEWLEGENWFYLQGIVHERTKEIVHLRMQRNYWQNCTEEEIAASVHYLKIKNCPSNLRKSQFWKLAVSFKEGFLHCLTGEKLADAATTKKILKSWKTDPLHITQYEELLKR